MKNSKKIEAKFVEKKEYNIKAEDLPQEIWPVVMEAIERIQREEMQKRLSEEKNPLRSEKCCEN